MVGTSRVAPPESYFHSVTVTMGENEQFLREHAKATCDEVIELVNDAIEYVGFAVTKGPPGYARYSMLFFLHHILMPFSYAIYVDMLAGNMPVCYMQLRLMLESLVKCYAADVEHNDSAFFYEKLELLEEDMQREKRSIAKLMKELGRRLGLDFVALWGKLSHDWVHTKGIMARVVNHLITESGVPPWALLTPMNYTEDDLDSVDELRRRICEFRSLLTATMGKYQQELGFL